MPFEENAKKFDRGGEIRTEIDAALQKLEAFRNRFPFHKDPKSIDRLTPEKLYNPRVSKDYFFYWLEYTLRPLGWMTVGSTVGYRSATEQIDLFKELLRGAVSSKLSLAERVNLDWGKIRGLGGERIIAKKIISVYDDDVLPIFSTNHLKRIHDSAIGRGRLPRNFDQMSLGEKYEVLMDGLLKEKKKADTTAKWDSAYFMRFLYHYYFEEETPMEQPEVRLESLRRNGLNDVPLTELDVLFLFAKLHKDLGFPLITKVQTEYPDVHALDARNNTVKIEIEYRASHFDNHKHPPDGCDIVVCWENDLGDAWPEHWPQVISLREYLSEDSETG